LTVLEQLFKLLFLFWQLTLANLPPGSIFCTALNLKLDKDDWQEYNEGSLGRKEVKTMANPINKVSYNCGCKFQTGKYAEAAAHVEQTGHTMTVLGTILPANKNSKKGA
jgi:hypothetical protein